MQELLRILGNQIIQGVLLIMRLSSIYSCLYSCITTSLCALFLSGSSLHSEDLPTNQKQVEEAFTGKVLKNRVRMRLQPSLDAYIFSELKRDEMILVTHQVDDFHACIPPKGLKGYVFRTYVLDNMVEGSNVNIRLEPDTTSPVIAQLNTGDMIVGVVAPQNNKWLEIELPASVRFYVAKDFVGKAGPVGLYAEHGNRQQKVRQDLVTLELQLENELQKPFSEIQLSSYANQLNQIIAENDDMPEEVNQARELTAKMQQVYLTKGLTSPQVASPSSEDTVPVQYFAELVTEADEREPQLATVQPITSQPTTSSWQQQEEQLINKAISSGDITSLQQFYANQQENAVEQTGTIKPYASHVKNRPGDFLLIDEKSHLPVAYLYSTTVDLQALIGKKVTLQLSERPNNHFAFPAFFVLSAKE